MSNTITISPTISYVNGVITESSVNSIISEIENALNIIGDRSTGERILYGSESSMLSTVGSKIPSIPYGILVQQCSDLFTVSGNEYTLSLIPSSTQLSFSFSESYQYVSEITSNTIRQYTISGRIITFSVTPSQNFSVTYSGYMPQDYGAEINRQVLYPNPELIKNGKDSYPVVEKISQSQNIYSITLSNRDGIESTDTVLQTGVQSYLPVEIQQYVSSSGLIEVPLDIASVWVYENDTYTKINIEYFKILSSSVFSIKTVDPISINGQYIVSIISKSITDIISELYLAYKNHTHDNFGNTKRINHKSIVIDSGSDSHPEYFRRDGYNSTLKKNNINGPLFLSSINSASFGSNVLSKSNSIYFGDFAIGHKLYREETAEGYLTIDPRDSSGIEVLIAEPLEGQASKNIMKSSDFNIHLYRDLSSTKTSAVIDAGNRLIINSDNGLFSEKITSNNIVVPILGKITFNGVDVTSTQGGMVFSCQNNKAITFSNGVTLSDSILSNSTISNNNVPTGSKINFGNNYLLSDTNAIKLNGKLSINDYAEISVVSENNDSPISLSNVTTIKSSSKVLFLRPVSTGLTIGNTQYSFLETVTGHTRIDRVSDWPKQDASFGNIDAYSLKVNESSFDEKSGISFGVTAKIYTSTNDSVCSLDSLVVESKDDVVFLKTGDTNTDCESKDFAGLRVGSISSNGTLASESIHVNGNGTFGDIAVSSATIDEVGNITTDANISSKTISVSGNSSFGDVSCSNIKGLNVDAKAINGQSATISGSVSISQDLNVSSGISAKALSVADSVSAKRIISESLETGTIKSTDISSSGSLNVSNRISCSSVESSGEIISSSSVTASNVYAKTEVITKYIESETLTCSSGTFNKSIKTSTISVDGEAIISGSTRISGDIISSGGITVDGQAKFYSGLVVRNGADLSGSIVSSGDVTIAGKAKMSDIETTNISANGNITAISASIEGLLQAKIINISERADFSSATFSDGISVSKDIDATKTSKLTIGEISTANISISGRTGYDDKIESYVDIYAYKNMTVSNIISGNIISASSAFTLGSQENSDAVYLTTSGLHFSKETAILGVKTITSENMIGRAVIPYTELSQFNSNISSGIISAISQSKFTVADNLSVDGILNVPRSLVVGGTLFFNKIVPLDSDNGYIDIVAGSAVYE